jgi:outer membrane receptor protein involved in Fe transport
VNRTDRKRLLTTTIMSGAMAAMAVPALAQDASSNGSQTTAVQEIVVTGSRIPRPNTTAVSPIQTVGQKEFKLQGTVDAEALLNNLPAVSASSTQSQNGGGIGEGIATVDLRGFGPQRTLVLIDGRRMPPGDAQEPVPDLNLIPTSLIDNVDVLTGGAASIYGSDAIAGVVNFKMKHNFDGIQIDAQYGFDQHNNDNSAADAILTAAGHKPPTGETIQGRSEKVTVTFGINSADGKANFEGYLGYINQDPVLQGAYDTEACTVISVFTANGVTGHACSGSSNSAYGNFQGKFYGALNGNNWQSSNTLNPVSQTLSDNPGGSNFVRYASAPPGAVNRAWNYAPFQYLQRQDTRYQGGYFGNYEFNDHVTAYSDFMFQQDTSTGQLAPSGLFTNGPSQQVNCADPLMSAGQQQAFCGPDAGNPNVMSGPHQIGYRLQNRVRDLQHTHSALKMDVGARGDLDDAWSYDVYVQYGRADSTTKEVGDVSLSRIANALNAIPDGHGGVMCANAAARSAGCVPLNIFQPLSAGITADQFNYIEEDSNISGFTTQQVASANLVGKLGKYGIKSPWANDGVGVALGAEYRRDYLNDSPDAATTSGDLAGTSVGGTPKVAGSTNVKELYGELHAPIVSNLFLAEDVSLDLSYRRSNYNLAGESDTWKAGGDWQVTQDIRFRGAYSRTERAPNVVELFIPQSIQNGELTDPCAGATPLYSAAVCYRTSNLAGAGVSEQAFTQNIYGQIPDCPAGECNVKVGGNTALKPEVAYTTTLGFVATPRWIPGLYASVDYWDINLENAIGTLPVTGILQGCYQNNIASLCDDIHRDPNNGSINGTQGYIFSASQNLTSIHKRGWDVQANYTLHLGDIHGLPDWGSVNTDFVGTYLAHNTITVPVEGSYDCAGLFGATCGQPTPHWRHKVRFTWATPWNVDLSMQWRYIAQVKADVNSSNPIMNFGVNDIIDGKIPAYSYIDLAGSWRIRDHLILTAGVNNVFDKDPPVLDTLAIPLASAPTNSWPQMYDALGRSVFISLSAKF